jgi:hypothetical protein
MDDHGIVRVMIPLFCLSIASMRSNSSKSKRRMGLEIDVSFTPRFIAAALILESAGFPFTHTKKAVEILQRKQ